MQFTVSRADLLECLGSVAGVVPSKSTLPILSHLLFQAEEKKTSVTATDLDISVRLHLNARIAAQGSVALPARMLLEISRTLADGPVSVVVEGDRATIECGESHFKIVTLSGEDFPALPKVEFAEGLEVEGSVLNALVHHTTFAASSDESRPVLTGVLWEIGGGEMSMVATDGHRLARYTVKTKLPSGFSAEHLIPTKALEQVIRLFPDDDAIKIASGENHVAFLGEAGTVYSRLVEGTYPNYQQVIPTDNDKTAVCSREALTAALRRMAVVADPQTHRVGFRFAGGGLTISTETPDVGEAREPVPAEYQGDDLEIGFNASYLLDILRYMDSEEVRMSFKAHDRATVLTPADGEKAPNCLYLVMPMRLGD